MASLKNWDELIDFKPTQRLQGNLTIRTGGRIQFLEDGLGDISKDLYRIRVDKLPRKFSNPEALLSKIRKNINDFIDTSITRFSPYDVNNSEKRLNLSKWKSDKPLEAIMDIAIALPGLPFFSLTSENATVVVSQFFPKRWIFSTVYTHDNGYHPVSGNREFGVHVGANGGVTIYTKGVDRVSGVLDHGANSFFDSVVEGQEALWRSFQTKVANFVNREGGEARTITRILRTDRF